MRRGAVPRLSCPTKGSCPLKGFSMRALTFDRERRPCGNNSDRCLINELYNLKLIPPTDFSARALAGGILRYYYRG